MDLILLVRSVHRPLDFQEGDPGFEDRTQQVMFSVAKNAHPHCLKWTASVYNWVSTGYNTHKYISITNNIPKWEIFKALFIKQVFGINVSFSIVSSYAKYLCYSDSFSLSVTLKKAQMPKIKWRVCFKNGTQKYSLHKWPSLHVNKKKCVNNFKYNKRNQNHITSNNPAESCNT